MQRIISSDRGFTLVTVPDNGDRRIEISLEDSDKHVELRMPMSGSSTATLSMPPDLVKSVHEWLGCWLAAQGILVKQEAQP